MGGGGVYVGLGMLPLTGALGGAAGGVAGGAVEGCTAGAAAGGPPDGGGWDGGGPDGGGPDGGAGKLSTALGLVIETTWWGRGKTAASCGTGRIYHGSNNNA